MDYKLWWVNEGRENSIESIEGIEKNIRLLSRWYNALKQEISQCDDLVNAITNHIKVDKILVEKLSDNGGFAKYKEKRYLTELSHEKFELILANQKIKEVYEEIPNLLKEYYICLDRIKQIGEIFEESDELSVKYKQMFDEEVDAIGGIDEGMVCLIDVYEENIVKVREVKNLIKKQISLHTANLKMLFADKEAEEEPQYLHEFL